MIQTFHYIWVFTPQPVTTVVDNVYLCSIALLRLANSSYLSVHRLGKDGEQLATNVLIILGVGAYSLIVKGGFHSRKGQI